jgi:cobalt-zinc-cadmium efflux system outer membrane protein
MKRKYRFQRRRRNNLLAGWLCPALVCLGAETSEPVRESDLKTLSLEALVSETVRNNPELEFYRAEIAAAKAGRKSAGQWNNPELTAEVGDKRVWDRGGSALGDGAAWSVAVAQAFEFPGRIALRKAIANQEVELALLGLEQFQMALAARTRARGYAVLATQQKADAVREVAQRFQSLLEVLVQRDPAGIAPLLDQRIIEASAITLGRRASQAILDVQTALMELNHLRGQPPTTPLKLTGTIDKTNRLPSLPTLLAVARTNNFELRIRRAELAQQGFQVQLSKNERWPKVTLAPFYAAETANDEQRIVGMGLSLPLPLWHRNEGSIHTAQARQQQAEVSLQVAHRQVERQVTDHALACQAKLQEMARWRPDAPRQFREAAELADRHYRLGAVPVTTYVEMQMRYLDALDALLATQSETLEHRQQLELALGRPLESIDPQ